MSLLFSMFSYSLAMSISPGPVNMIILSSGINHGIKLTIPYVSGATLGFTLLLLFVGIIFEKFITEFPFFLTYLAVSGSLYIIYIGYKIASSQPEMAVKNRMAPRFWEGFFLQWLNPKAWIACVSGASLFSHTESYTTFLTFATLYSIVCYVSLLFWAILGNKVSFLLSSRLRLRLFNISMGLLLIATALYLIIEKI